MDWVWEGYVWSPGGINTHHSCRALDDLPGFALLVNLAEAGPLSQLHVGVHLDQWDAMLLHSTMQDWPHCSKSDGRLIFHDLILETSRGCTWQRAVTNFLYIGSSQLSARMQRRACLQKENSLTDCLGMDGSYLLSRALAASLRPLAKPSPISACFSTYIHGINEDY